MELRKNVFTMGGSLSRTLLLLLLFVFVCKGSNQLKKENMRKRLLDGARSQTELRVGLRGPGSGVNLSEKERGASSGQCWGRGDI